MPGTDTPANREKYAHWLKLIEQHPIPLAALWVYDFSPQDGEWNITPDNDRAWQLEALLSAAKSR